jgi:hypothetical protein
MSDNIYHPRNLPLSAWLREQILQLWEKNVSAVEIARTLNPLLRERGEKALTRNAVIGHVYRARVAGDIRAEARTLSKINAERSKDREAREENTPRIVKKNQVSLAVVRFTESPLKENLTILQPLLVKEPRRIGNRTVLTIRANECHFPMEDFDKDNRRFYCAKDVVSVLKPYCQHHISIMYRRVVAPEMNALT